MRIRTKSTRDIIDIEMITAREPKDVSSLNQEKKENHYKKYWNEVELY